MKTLLYTFLLFTIGCAPQVNGQKVRPAAVAGAFYPASPQKLTLMVDNLLARASAPKISAVPIALIVPHAGYVYSGAVAAEAFAQLKGRNVQRVVLIAPSHYDYFEGASIYDGEAYSTPLGTLKVDGAFAGKLAKKSALIFRSGRGHGMVNGRGEHAVEVELPFLQRTLKTFTLVPIVMGEQSYETCRALGVALAELIKDGKTIIVASSDLSHYHPYEDCIRRDKKVLQAIKEWDYYSLSKNFNARIWQACGGGPIVATMMAAERLGANRAQLLKYANSGDIPGGDKSRVVGYSAWALYRAADVKSGDAAEFNLNKAQQKVLLQIARRAVEEAVRTGRKYEPPPPQDETLRMDRGAFVTLSENSRLRGCIGYTSPVKPLYLTVRDVAMEAALHDPRFSAVSEAELPLLHYEISVLSPFRHVLNIRQIKVGRDGLLIKKGAYAGLLLPQVAVDRKWDRMTFLRQTCRKAGLPLDAWKNAQTDIFRFSAFVFGEE